MDRSQSKAFQHRLTSSWILLTMCPIFLARLFRPCLRSSLGRLMTSCSVAFENHCCSCRIQTSWSMTFRDTRWPFKFVKFPMKLWNLRDLWFLKISIKACSMALTQPETRNRTKTLPQIVLASCYLAWFIIQVRELTVSVQEWLI